jgi:hypothetical protein
MVYGMERDIHSPVYDVPSNVVVVLEIEEDAIPFMTSYLSSDTQTALEDMPYTLSLSNARMADDWTFGVLNSLELLLELATYLPFPYIMFDKYVLDTDPMRSENNDVGGHSNLNSGEEKMFEEYVQPSPVPVDIRCDGPPSPNTSMPPDTDASREHASPTLNASVGLSSILILHKENRVLDDVESIDMTLFPIARITGFDEEAISLLAYMAIGITISFSVLDA